MSEDRLTPQQTLFEFSGRGSLIAVPALLAVVAALVVAVATFAILTGLTPLAPTSQLTYTLIGLNAVLILILCALVFIEIRRVLLARRDRKAASRLHVRIVLLFSIVAAVPAILVAIVASITLDLGLDRWFDLRTRSIVNSSIEVAEAYVEENARLLQGTTLTMAFSLDSSEGLYRLDRTGFRRLITSQARGRGLIHAAMVRPDGSEILSANVPKQREKPIPEAPTGALETAADGRPVLIPPGRESLVGAIIKLNNFEDAYLYTVRAVDPEVTSTLQRMRANTLEYNELEENRINTQIAFALLYINFSLSVLLPAIWTAVAVANRLVRPIRQLISAADEVAAGNLDVSVPVRSSDGDVGSLAATFNEMTQQLTTQRNELLSANAQIDERRRFSEAVLSGVNAAVIGVNASGVVTVVNRAAQHMINAEPGEIVGQNLVQIGPELALELETAIAADRNAHRNTVTVARRGHTRTYNVQITMEQSESDAHSYVITVDDITDLVEAQRSTAWSDVARRIAHEIKNPLTPIQLSAERLKRRFGRQIDKDLDVFEQCTETIIRQVNDIGRMVNEFSSFARMPAPSMSAVDLRDVLKEASFLTEVSRSDVILERQLGGEPLMGDFDSRLLAQAFGNIVKNAAESIDGIPVDKQREGHILVSAERTGDRVIVRIIDNGKGFPQENRERLLEPYMTTREKGTGLGLAIVKKIIEDHDGQIELADAPSDFHGGGGAMVMIKLPLTDKVATSEKQPFTTSHQMEGS